MANQFDDDWVVKVTLDTSDVDRQYKKVQKTLEKSISQRARAVKGEALAKKKSVDALSKENQLLVQQNALRKRIAKAEELGLGKIRMSRSQNPVFIRNKVLELDKQIFAQQKKLAKLAETERAKAKADKDRLAAQLAIGPARPTAAQIRLQEKAAKQRLKDQLAIGSPRPTAAQLRQQSKSQPFVGPMPLSGMAKDAQLKATLDLDRVQRQINNTFERGSAKFEQYTRSVNAMRGSVRSASSREGIIRLRDGIKDVRLEVSAAVREQSRYNKELHKGSFAARGMSASIRNLARSSLSIYAVIAAGSALVRVGKDFDSLNATLLAASGGAEAAAEDFKFIKQTALTLGLDLKEVANGFKSIGAAGRASNLTTEQTRDIFLAATESARAFGLSAERTGLVYLAFSQILSKGKVSTEELRRYNTIGAPCW